MENAKLENSNRKIGIYLNVNDTASLVPRLDNLGGAAVVVEVARKQKPRTIRSFYDEVPKCDILVGGREDNGGEECLELWPSTQLVKRGRFCYSSSVEIDCSLIGSVGWWGGY